MVWRFDWQPAAEPTACNLEPCPPGVGPRQRAHAWRGAAAASSSAAQGASCEQAAPAAAAFGTHRRAGSRAWKGMPEKNDAV